MVRGTIVFHKDDLMGSSPILAIFLWGVGRVELRRSYKAVMKVMLVRFQHSLLTASPADSGSVSTKNGTKVRLFLGLLLL